MPQENPSDQLAQGSFIAQATAGSVASVTVLHKLAPRQLPAIAPPPPTSFVGRSTVLAKIGSLFADVGTGHLVALVGMGGIGKTSLAKKIGRDFASSFHGGVFWCSFLVTNGNVQPILHSWSLTCGYELDSNLNIEAKLSVLRNVLNERYINQGRLLFILDDIQIGWFETAKDLIEILPSKCCGLVTTREESVVHALNAILMPVDVLDRNDSQQLLNIYTNGRTFGPSSNGVVKLLDILDGLPFAIEIAGKKIAYQSRKPGFKLETFCNQIEQRAGETLTVFGQKGLAATFETSYEGLNDFSKMLFRLLGCFASSPILLSDLVGIIHLEASIEITSAQLEAELDEMAHLSLLNWCEVPQCYSLHNLMHQFARDLLRLRKEEESQAIAAHTTYYSGYLLDKQANMTEEFLNLRLANVLLAADRAYYKNDSESFLRFVNSLAKINGYLYSRGYWNEAHELLTRACDLDAEKKNPITRNLIWHLGTLKREQGKYVEAKYLLAALVKFEKETGGKSSIANGLFALGYVHLYLADYQVAKLLLEEAMQYSQESDSDYALGESLRGLGRIYLSQNDLITAQHYFEISLPILERVDNLPGYVYALRGLGESFTLQKNSKNALDRLLQALEIARKIRDKQAESYTLRALGNLHASNKDFELAKQVFTSCLQITSMIGEKGSYTVTQCLLGDVLLELGEMEAALELFRSCLVSSKSLGLRRWNARSLFGLANVLYLSGDKASALNYSEESLSILCEIKHRDALMVEEWLKTHLFE